MSFTIFVIGDYLGVANDDDLALVGFHYLVALVYTGVLARGNTELQTAWWYFDGHVQTIGQMDWRARMLKGGDPFSLINVTAADEPTLFRNLEQLFKDQRIVLRHRH